MDDFEIEVELTDGEDCIRLRGPTVESIAAVWPVCVENPYLQRFFRSGEIERVFTEPHEVEEEWKSQNVQASNPTQTAGAPGVSAVGEGSTASTDGVTDTSNVPRVRKVTADEVMAAAPRRGDLSRSEAFVDPDRLASPAMRVVVKKVTGEEPPEDLTHGRAQELLKGGK